MCPCEAFMESTAFKRLHRVGGRWIFLLSRVFSDRCSCFPELRSEVRQENTVKLRRPRMVFVTQIIHLFTQHIFSRSQLVRFSLVF